MPDFDTRARREPEDQNGPRSLSIVSTVRDLLIAMRLRTLLICGGILLSVLLALPVGLLILAPETVVCDEWQLEKAAVCGDLDGSVDLNASGTVEVCKADSRAEVDSSTPCREPVSSDPLVCTGNHCFPGSSYSEAMKACRTFLQQANNGTPQADNVGPGCRQTGFLSFLVRELAFAIWLLV